MGPIIPVIASFNYLVITVAAFFLNPDIIWRKFTRNLKREVHVPVCFWKNTNNKEPSLNFNKKQFLNFIAYWTELKIV